jgi:hypothetical protein
LFEQAEQHKHQQLSEIKGDSWLSNLMNRASDEVVALYEWSSSACEAQFTDVMHQLSANQNRAAESKTDGASFPSPADETNPSSQHRAASR